jgi:hypothetical protein
LATPRQTYPSDEARKKQRPHVKVHLSCRSHPRYGKVFEDPEQRGMAWGLWLLAVQYHAAQTGDEVALGHGDITWLTGRSRWATALVALRQLCDSMAYPMRCEGRRVYVEIRNLQRKQGFDSASRGASTRSSAPSEEQKNRRTDSEEPTPKKRREESASGAPAPAAELPPEDHCDDVVRLAKRAIANDRPLLNLLANQPGCLGEKEHWLATEIDKMKASVTEKKPISAMVIGWYQTYLRGERKFKDYPTLAEHERLLRATEAIAEEMKKSPAPPAFHIRHTVLS